MFQLKSRLQTILGIALFLFFAASAANADESVLSDMPGCFTRDQIFRAAGDPADLVEVSMVYRDSLPSFGANPISGVPDYKWWNGCSPTSGGMMVAYWDAQPGYERLFDGDASTWYGDGSSGTRRMVASDAHIISGAENGQTYGDWHNSVSYPDHESNPNCIADFMKTVNGGSTASNIAAGLEAYVEWDDPSTPTNNEHYDATVVHEYIPRYQGSLSYDTLKGEIDAGRPILLDVVTLSREGGTVAVMLGHSTVAYGYQDDMFTVKVPGGVGDQTVGGFAVMDTWGDGTFGSEWINPSMELISSIIDGNGVEWWPFIEYPNASWVYSASGSYGPYDWMVIDGHMLDVVPEPATLVLLATGLIGVWWFRKRK